MIDASPGTPIETLYDGMVPDGSSTRHQGGINAEDVNQVYFISSFYRLIRHYNTDDDVNQIAQTIDKGVVKVVAGVRLIQAYI